MSAYSNPLFYTYNAALDDPNVAVNPWTANGAIDSDAPLVNLHNYDTTKRTTWTTPDTTHYVTLDRGTGTLGKINRMVMAKTNLLLVNAEVRSDTTTAFSPGTILRANNLLFSTNENWQQWDLIESTDRYIRVFFNSSVAPDIGALLFTYAQVMTRGPVNDWSQGHEVDKHIFRNGPNIGNESAKELWEFDWRKLSIADASVIRAPISGIQSSENSDASPFSAGSRIVLFKNPRITIANASIILPIKLNLKSYKEDADFNTLQTVYTSRIHAEYLEVLI